MTKVLHQKTENLSYKISQDFFKVYMDAAHGGSVVLSFFIYFGCTFEHLYGIYILSLNKVRGTKMSIWGCNQKKDQGRLQPSFGKCAGVWRFAAPHSARLLLFKEGNSLPCLVL